MNSIIQDEAEIEKRIIKYIKNLNNYDDFPTIREIYDEVFRADMNDPDTRYIGNIIFEMEKRNQIVKEKNGYKLNGIIHKIYLE